MFKSVKTVTDPPPSPAKAYIGPADGALARTADAVIVLDDSEGELPVHMAYLCHGALHDAVILALDKTLRDDRFRIRVQGCSRDSVILFLRLLYSLRSDETAKAMKIEELKSAGLVADRFGFKDILSAVEVGLFSKLVRGGAAWTMTAEHTSMLFGTTAEKVLQLAEWAEAVSSMKIGRLCGYWLGLKGFKVSDAKTACMLAAMQAHHWKGSDATLHI